MLTSTFSPTANSKELRTNNVSSTTWSADRSLATADAVTALNNINFHNCDETGGSDGWFLISRLFLWFDLTVPATGLAIPANSIINSAKIVFPIVSKTESDNSLSFGFTAHTGASPITTADWDSCTINTPTEYATRKALSALSTTVTTDITLNATALTAITSKIGTTLPILMRGNLDIDNSIPNTSTHFNEPAMHYENFVLSVDYTPPSSGYIIMI